MNCRPPTVITAFIGVRGVVSIQITVLSCCQVIQVIKFTGIFQLLQLFSWVVVYFIEGQSHLLGFISY